MSPQTLIKLLSQIAGALLLELSKQTQFDVQYVPMHQHLPERLIISVIRSKSFNFFGLTQPISFSLRVPVARIYPSDLGTALSYELLDQHADLTAEEQTFLSAKVSHVEHELNVKFKRV